ncbi:MAG TPA: helix-turn-helix domain-containing protein, partial [Nannocystaceae bacterium]|nr:helix-turn-helix domain-containing protein [Nannocystaceae bacterium]
MTGRELVLSRARDIAVFVSPVRQEIFAAIGLHGPLTATAIASHLGRATTSLYHHLAQLVRIGAVEVKRTRREDGKAEQVYAAAVGRVAICEGAGTNAVQARQDA